MDIQLKQKMACIAVVTAFGIGGAFPCLAQATSSESTAAHKIPAVKHGAGEVGKADRDYRASKVIGKNVENAQGENLGEIKDLIVDLGSQRVHYAVLSFGGALGLGDKLFAYPISSFKTSADSDKLVLNVDKDKLKNAPGFDKDKWPDWADNRYRGDVDRYFKSDTAKAAPHNARFMRASELIGKNVSDRAGKNAGEIDELVVNMNTGRIPYVVLDFDKAWSLDDKLLPLPMSALTFPTAKNKNIVLNVDRNKLDMARGFDEDHWPDLNAAEFRRDTRAYLARIDRPATRADRAADTTMHSSGASR